MDTVWIKLNGESGVTCEMFGPGGIVRMIPANEGRTSLFNASVYVTTVDESIDEIHSLIGSARNGVKVGESKGT